MLKTEGATSGASKRRRRRQVLKGLAWLMVLPLGALWRAALQRRRLEGVTRAPLRVEPPQGVSFHGDVIVHHSAEGIVALSARCPHLGCKVDRLMEGELVCPCHGSRFSLDGAVLRGPATEGLRPLTVRPGGGKSVLVDPA